MNNATMIVQWFSKLIDLHLNLKITKGPQRTFIYMGYIYKYFVCSIYKYLLESKTNKFLKY